MKCLHVACSCFSFLPNPPVGIIGHKGFCASREAGVNANALVNYFIWLKIQRSRHRIWPTGGLERSKHDTQNMAVGSKACCCIPLERLLEQRFCRCLSHPDMRTSLVVAPLWEEGGGQKSHEHDNYRVRITRVATQVPAGCHLCLAM